MSEKNTTAYSGPIIIGTYNMSFASDLFDTPEKLKATYPSEYAFMLKNKGDPRAFWENAKLHLNDFIIKNKPIAVGLQEMNLTKEGSKTGSDSINEMLKEINLTHKDVNYVQKCMGVEKNNAGLSIIVDINRTGNVNISEIIDNANQGGRPLLMVLTDKNYLFTNMHGAQDTNQGGNVADFNLYMIKNNKNFLQEKATKFLNENLKPEETVNKIYVMGDFNDRFGAINNIEIGDKTLKYEGEAPRACCHNWDSSAKKDRRETLLDANNKETTYARGKNPSFENKIVYDKNFNTENNFDPKTEIPDEDVKISNYLNKGDLIFSKEGGKLEIYESSHNLNIRDVSKASDHELVYMTVGVTTGGRYTKKRRSKKRNSNKRKSTKNKRKSKRK